MASVPKVNGPQKHGDQANVPVGSGEAETKTGVKIFVEPEFYLDLRRWGLGVVQIEPTERVLARMVGYHGGRLEDAVGAEQHIALPAPSGAIVRPFRPEEDPGSEGGGAGDHSDPPDAPGGEGGGAPDPAAEAGGGAPKT